MPIIPRLDRVMADRKMSVNELSQRIDISPVNISRMRRGHIKAVRFSTMERICEVLQCQPGDLFEYVSPEPGTEEAAELGAIVNREIEEPARKPIGAVSRTPVNVANESLPQPAPHRTPHRASFFMSAKHPPKSVPRELHPRETYLRETHSYPDAPFLQHRGGSVEAGRSTSPDEGRLSGKFPELFDMACLQWTN